MARSITRDKQILAKKPGWRGRAKGGKEYYEARRNRADSDKRTRLSGGGARETEMTEYEKLLADPKIDSDEKEIYKEEISDLKKKLEGAKSAPVATELKAKGKRGRPSKREKTIENIEKNPPSAPKKKDDTKPAYDCDELIAQVKEKKAKAKINAAKRASEPKKSEATKIKDAIIKVEEKVENKYEKMGRADITKLIAETKSLLKQLEKALKAIK